MPMALAAHLTAPPVSVIAGGSPSGIRTRIDRATRSHRPAQRFAALGVGDDRIHVDHGLCGDGPGSLAGLRAMRPSRTASSSTRTSADTFLMVDRSNSVSHW